MSSRLCLDNQKNTGLQSTVNNIFLMLQIPSKLKMKDVFTLLMALWIIHVNKILLAWKRTTIWISSKLPSKTSKKVMKSLAIIFTSIMTAMGIHFSANVDKKNVIKILKVLKIWAWLIKFLCCQLLIRRWEIFGLNKIPKLL